MKKFNFIFLFILILVLIFGGLFLIKFINKEKDDLKNYLTQPKFYPQPDQHKKNYQYNPSEEELKRFRNLEGKG